MRVVSRKRAKFLLVGVILGVFLFIMSFSAWALVPKYTIAKEMYIIHATKTPFSPPSVRWGNYSMKEAYEIQSILVSMLKPFEGDVAGYKVALSSKAAQKKFGVPYPVWGRLLSKHVLKPGAIVKLSSFIKPFVEVEIGFKIKQDIKRKLNSKELARYIECVFGAVELPDIRFAPLKGLKGVDIVADNAGAAKVIVGTPKKYTHSLKDVKVKLYRDGRLINIGYGRQALGDPYKSLLWLVNDVISRGGVVKKGSIVITGALGRMLPLKPGKYTATYGPLGCIRWEVVY